MKRFVVVVFAAALLALGGAVPISADTTGDAPLGCADIASGGVSYNFTAEPAQTVTGSLTTVDPACGAVIFTLHVEYVSGGSTVSKSDSVRGRPTSTTVGGFEVTGVSADGGTEGSVCTWFTSSFRGFELDRAPNEGCVVVPADGSAGGAGSY